MKKPENIAHIKWNLFLNFSIIFCTCRSILKDAVLKHKYKKVDIKDKKMKQNGPGRGLHKIKHICWRENSRTIIILLPPHKNRKVAP